MNCGDSEIRSPRREPWMVCCLIDGEEQLGHCPCSCCRTARERLQVEIQVGHLLTGRESNQLRMHGERITCADCLCIVERLPGGNGVTARWQAAEYVVHLGTGCGG